MIRYIKNLLFILLVPALASSCFTKKPEQQVVDYKTGMMEADRAFSKLSEERGMKYALMQYIDSKGVLLRPNAIPIIGVEAIDYISQGNDTSYTMTWEPNGGTIAKSGELGYTYGVYSYKPKNKDTVIYGTYVSIWKRQPDGKWKFVLETGNEGIE
jgi:ketosteroid isomerase-like protein